MTREPPPPPKRDRELQDSAQSAGKGPAKGKGKGGTARRSQAEARDDSSARDEAQPRAALEALRAILDDHLAWLPRWHQAAFFDMDALEGGDDPQLDARCKTPLAEREPMSDELTNQPAFQKLSETHGEMHRLARSMLVAQGLGQALDAGEYERFAQTAGSFFNQLRRLERAFAAASSGIDPLTGLRNRNGMLAEIGREHARFERTGKPYCIAVADLDRFKEINDTYGHDIGDRVLGTMAGVLVHNIRPFDDAYRMGGEEFLVVLKETPLDTAKTVIERVRAAIEAESVKLDDGTDLPITCSFGLAEADTAASVSTLLSRADDTLYAVKGQGRNAVAAWPAGAPGPQAAEGKK